MSKKIQGYHEKLDSALIRAIPRNLGNNRDNRAWLAGFCTALLAFRNSAMPGAYIRSPEVREIQYQVNTASAQALELYGQMKKARNLP